jgi:hypothetical protein
LCWNQTKTGSGWFEDALNSSPKKLPLSVNLVQISPVPNGLSNAWWALRISVIARKLAINKFIAMWVAGLFAAGALIRMPHAAGIFYV